MINEHLDRNVDQLQFKLSMFKSLNDDQQFLIVYLVVAFSRKYVLAIEDNRM